ncbi:MAG TPA: cytochrome c biogenesis protein CcsA [Casimicrobiaceae bacterium]|nr:cytochrome c biogenesis protein CcsA [Casimicrobiaceae bacterium]
MILLYLLVPAAYLLAAMLEWGRLAPSRAAVSARSSLMARWLAAFALAGHAVLVDAAVVTPDGLDVSFANTLSAVAGLIALFAWLGTLARALPGILAVALPVAAIAAPLPAVFPNPHEVSFPHEPFALLHIAVALVAYSLLIVAALEALILLGLERRLHRGLPDPAGAKMPPLLTLERLLFRLVDIGFVLLTLAMVSGALFSEELFGKPLRFTHKVVFSVLGWLVFAALVFGRYRYGWRGRTALGWVLAGTALLLLAYVGSKFVLEVLLGR